MKVALNEIESFFIGRNGTSLLEIKLKSVTKVFNLVYITLEIQYNCLLIKTFIYFRIDIYERLKTVLDLLNLCAKRNSEPIKE